MVPKPTRCCLAWPPVTSGRLLLFDDRFAARMYRTALRMLGSREDADDVVQDVFLAVVRSHERLGDVRDLTAYLFSALHRAVGRCASQRARAVQISPNAAEEAIVAAQPVASENSDWERLQEAIRALPDQQREVVTLRVDGELTFAQIAQVMGGSISTAASRYQYALKKLRASLFGTKNSLEGKR